MAEGIVKSDPHLRAEFLLRAARAGDGIAARQLGEEWRSFLEGGARLKNELFAMECLRAVAEARDAATRYNLGVAYAKGLGG